ncbi:hypothetical protein [Echinicola sediminis]
MKKIVQPYRDIYFSTTPKIRFNPLLVNLITTLGTDTQVKGIRTWPSLSVKVLNEASHSSLFELKARRQR